MRVLFGYRRLPGVAVRSWSFLPRNPGRNTVTRTHQRSFSRNQPEGTRESIGRFDNSFIQSICNSKPPEVILEPAVKGEDDIENLKGTVARPLWKIYWKIVRKQFAGPFRSLNQLNKFGAAEHMGMFVQELENVFSSFLRGDGSLKSWQDVTSIDFINPRIYNMAPIIYLIQQNGVPFELGQYYGTDTQEEFLEQILEKVFYKFFVEQSVVTRNQPESVVDLSNPAEWFPEARKMKRKLIMHVGPTNSGKTYNSLKKLAAAKSGYYAGPLRLLAREIYERFNDQGISCNLITGEEVIPSIDAFGKVSDVSSGTIEMIPTHKKMDICIIDEIQMIADPRRGEAWTNAVLGVQAKEVHMCGEESAVPLIKRLAKITGDDIEINKYHRLGKLLILNKPVINLNNLKKGDCVIAFSKRKILELKCEIERTSNLKVGVIYGALPPEIRSKEATSFNEGHYDVLVASDAVGMGINLRIKRIVFYATKKFNGSETIPLTVSETKQIAGRAGRYSNDQGELEGFVTAIYNKDLKFLKKVMNQPVLDLKKACIWPTNKIWTYYMGKFPKHTSFFDVLCAFENDTSSLVMDNFFLTSLDARYEILKLFLKGKLFKRTTVEDQLKLSLAPVNITVASPLVIDTTFKFFENITECQTKNIFDFNFLHVHILQASTMPNATADDIVQNLQHLEENHKLVLVFLWLSQRWPTLFVDKESAVEIKTLIEKRISEELINLRRLTKKTRPTGD